MWRPQCFILIKPFPRESSFTKFLHLLLQLFLFSCHLVCSSKGHGPSVMKALVSFHPPCRFGRPRCRVSPGLKKPLIRTFFDQSRRIKKQQLFFPGHLLLRGSLFPSLHSGATGYVFFFLRRVSSSGTIQLAGSLDQCTHGIPAEQTNMAACSLHMQMCPVSFIDGSELSSSRSPRQWTSHSACHTHTHMHTAHTCTRINTNCQGPDRKGRHNRDKYVSASGSGCYHPIERSCCWCEEKKTTTSAYWFWQSVSWMLPNVCLYNHIDAVEFVKKETEWFMVMMFDSRRIKPSQSSPRRVF